MNKQAIKSEVLYSLSLFKQPQVIAVLVLLIAFIALAGFLA